MKAGHWRPTGPHRKLDAAAVLRYLGRRGEVHPADVLAFCYPAYAETEAGWVEVIDLRPALGRHGVMPTDPGIAD